MAKHWSIMALALLVGTGHAVAQDAGADARFERLKAERAAEAARQREAQQRYEQGVRDAEAARARYDADMARHDQEVRRAQAAQSDYERRRADYETRTGQRGGTSEARARPSESRRPSREARNINEQCQRRARNRGRLIGGLVGGVAGGLVGRGRNPAAAIATALPVSLLLGEALTRLLDCREQEQAADATEQAVEQAAATASAPNAPNAPNAGAQRGVGTSVPWTSETRPGVTGSSTVTALEQEAGGGACMTVTDIVIVDGQETRAPKRLCRRPPSQRFVRV